MAGTSLGAPLIVCAVLLILSSVGVALPLTVENKRLVNRIFWMLSLVSVLLCVANVYWPPEVENSFHIFLSVIFALLGVLSLLFRFVFKKLNEKIAFALIFSAVLFGVLDLFF